MGIKSKLKASVIVMALATIPLASHAAGMGRLNVLSGLGQPFRAEIDLVAVQSAEAESLHAALAPADAFHEAQIEMPSSALGLRFDLEKRANGQYFISINSAQSINEPFLDFLVELKWDGGRVLREYTALLDPVGYAPGRVVSAQSAKSTPAVSTPPQTTRPVVAAEKPVAMIPSAKAPAAAPAPSGDSYTVKAGDSLAKIAHEHRVDGVSLEQMLVGLYQANKDAFEGNNMNRLKKGRILSLPTKDSLAGIDQHAAVQEIHAQAEDWRSYRAKLAESAGASQTSEAEPSSGKIAAKVEDKSTVKQAAPQDKLVLSKGDEAGKLKERVHSLEEDAAAKQKALADATARANELEQTNKKLEQLLAMKSKQGAEVQQQAEAAKSKPAAQAETKPAAPVPTPVTPAPVAEVKPAEAKPAAKPEAPKAEAEKAPAAQPPAPAAATEAPKPKPKKPLPPPIQEPEPSLFDSPVVLGGAGVGLIALLGGAFWWIRKRRKSSFEDSIITGSDLKSNTMVGNTGGAVISTGVTENSFLTDFSRAGLGTIDTDEVDPIAEAEVYMAYGRDAQAEEILKDALIRDGGRHEVRLKLLEIYSARKNVAAFESTAQELYGATQGQGAVWNQAATMGRVLDPQNSLYQHQEPVDTGVLDQTVVMSAGTLGDLSDTTKLREPLVTTESTSLDAMPVDIPSSDLDFQLDAAIAPQPEAEPAISSLDFDLGMAASEVPVAESAAEAPVADANFDLGELSLPEAAAEAPADEQHAMAAHTDDTALDFDLGEFSLDTPVSAPAVEVAAAPVAAEDGGMLSLDIPLEIGGEAGHVEHADLTVAPTTAEHEPTFELPPMDAGFDLDLGEPAAAVATARAADDVAVMDATALAELDSPDLATGLDFNFDLNEAAHHDTAKAADIPLGDVSLDLDVAPEPAISGDVMDFGAELDDPVTTKIDLARAYIDMGDKEGAREILQEAINEGTVEQKASAESLMAQL